MVLAWKIQVPTGEFSTLALPLSGPLGPQRNLKNWPSWWTLRRVYWFHIVALIQSQPSAQARAEMSPMSLQNGPSGEIWDKRKLLLLGHISKSLPHFCPSAHTPHAHWDISYHVVENGRKTVSVSKSACSEGTRSLLFDIVFPVSKQYLPCSRHSVSTYWMNEWTDEWMNETSREVSGSLASNL